MARHVGIGVELQLLLPNQPNATDNGLVDGWLQMKGRKNNDGCDL